MVGVWALLLGGGAWFAPAFASGGGDENTDPRDEAPTSPASAVWSYLRYGSNGDVERANAIVCERADPELSPADLLEISEQFSADFFEGRTPDLDVTTDDPVQSTNGTEVGGTVYYISRGRQQYADFTVTVQELEEGYCVSNAVRLDEPGESSEGETEVDPEAVAADYLAQIFRHQDTAAAEGYQCADYSGIGIEDIEQARLDWETANGTAEGYLNDMQSSESSSSDDSEVFNAEVTLDGFSAETFVFEVAVQGDCVASLEGGEGLMPAEED